MNNRSKIWDYYQTELRDSYAQKSKYSDPTYYFVSYLSNRGIIKGNIFCEVGFGDSGSLMLYSKMFQECYGLDISPQNIELTREEFRKCGISNTSFEVFDLLKDNHIRQKYNIVVVSHVLEHFTNKELERVVSTIKNMLKPNGFFVGATPYRLQFNYRICPNCGYKFEIDGHKQRFDKKNIVEKVGRSDFIPLIIRNHNFEYFVHNCTFLQKVLKRLNWEIFGYPQGQLEFVFQKRQS